MFLNKFTLLSEETVCPQSARYRTFSGYCNNLRNPSWGQAGTAQRRLSDRNGKPMVAYEDGTGLNTVLLISTI